jgi:cyclophilin family peptidyl-prolyl cis-trans isomerase
MRLRRCVQFFITVAPTPHLNKRHCVFGEVLEVRATHTCTQAHARVAQLVCAGASCALAHTLPMRVYQGYDVVKKLEKVGSGGGTPSKEVLIADCGELPVA